MKLYIPQPCAKHDLPDVESASTCIDCYRYVRFAAPGVRRFIGRLLRKPGFPMPCMRHIGYMASCKHCQQWAIIENKVSASEAKRANKMCLRAEHRECRDRERNEKKVARDKAKHAAHMALVEAQRADNDNRQTTVESGYVYVIVNPSFEGWLKIGSAVDVKARLVGYQTADPNRSFVIQYTHFTGERRLLEKMSHLALSEHERRGEWFLVKLDVARDTIKRQATLLKASKRF